MKPLLSVCIVTYNHEAYIRECLDSVVSQKTDFHFEVIIGDDCSTDGTATIVAEVAARYPTQIRAIRHLSNVGATANMLSVHNGAVGEFIAHMDGDDRMLPGKLQQQVDFLRSHPDHALVAHDVEVIDARSQVISQSFALGPIPASSDLNYLVSHGCFFPHSSKVYRRSAAISRPRERLTVDFMFHIEQARSGLIGYINRPLGQYRKTSAGISSKRSPYHRAVLLGHLDAFAYALQIGVSPKIVVPAMLRFRYVNAMSCIRAGQVSEFRMLASVARDELRWATFRQRLVFMCPAYLVHWATMLFDLSKQQRRYARW